MDCSKPANYDSVCQTKMLKYSLSQKWVINDFAELAEACEADKQVLNSKPFWNTSDAETRWMMQMYPAGETREGEDPPAQPSFSLYVNVSSKISKTARFEFFYLKPDGKPVSLHGPAGGKRRKWNQFAPNGGYGIRNNSRSSALAHLHPDGSLRLICEVGVKSAKDVVCIGSVDDSASITNCREEQLSGLSQAMGRVFQIGMYSDFTFIVGTDKFPVHRNILASQSEVFCRMFEGDFSENEEGEMKISDTTSDVMEHFLGFLYGQPPKQGFSEAAGDLLVLGEKYEITALKSAAEMELCRSLDTDTVCRTIVLANLNRAERLEKQCRQFILRHKAEVMVIKDWWNLREEHPGIVLKILDRDWGLKD